MKMKISVETKITQQQINLKNLINVFFQSLSEISYGNIRLLQL